MCGCCLCSSAILSFSFDKNAVCCAELGLNDLCCKPFCMVSTVFIMSSDSGDTHACVKRSQI